MYRVFNMGIGMVVVSPEELANSDQLYLIGKVEKGNGEVTIV